MARSSKRRTKASTRIYYIDNPGDQVTDDDGVDEVRTAVSLALPDSIENLTLLPGAVSGTGNSRNNVIAGNTLDNVLAGLGGSDTLRGGAGNDAYDVAADGKGDSDDFVISLSCRLPVREGACLSEIFTKVGSAARARDSRH